MDITISNKLINMKNKTLHDFFLKSSIYINDRVQDHLIVTITTINEDAERFAHSGI